MTRVFFMVLALVVVQLSCTKQATNSDAPYSSYPQWVYWFGIDTLYDTARLAAYRDYRFDMFRLYSTPETLEYILGPTMKGVKQVCCETIVRGVMPQNKHGGISVLVCMKCGEFDFCEVPQNFFNEIHTREISYSMGPPGRTLYEFDSLGVLRSRPYDYGVSNGDKHRRFLRDLHTNTCTLSPWLVCEAVRRGWWDDSYK
jgi:hypothetical protein